MFGSCFCSVNTIAHFDTIQIDFHDAKELCLFLCDCPDIQSTWDIMHHMDTSAMSAVEITEKLHFCHHSMAIQLLHGSHLTFASTAGRDPVHRLSDFDFSCEAQKVCLIQSSPSIMISCDFGNGQPCEARTRVFIRTNQQRRYVCGSCPGATASTCKAHLGPLSLNSQAAEQFNAKLNQISTQCAYLKQSNLMALVEK
jgi:hypothetical protein